MNRSVLIGVVVLLLIGVVGFVGCATTPRALHTSDARLQNHLASLDWKAAGDETVEVLQQYVRIDTTNPTGNETRGTDFLAAQLKADGLESEVVEFAPGRGTLVARLKATVPSGEKPLCLLSHVDTVPFEEAKWAKGPLSGDIVDGVLWGRGVLDMKGLGALELQAFRQLHRLKVPLVRDVILLAVADEEVAEGGMKLVTGPMWDSLGCGQIINEGGMGIRGVVAEGLTTFAISVGEKGILWAELVAEGEAGHGSTPSDDRAPLKLMQALAAFSKREAKPQVQAPMLEMLRRTGVKQGGFQGFVMQRPSLVSLFATGKLMKKPTTRASITNTCQVTGFDGKGSAPNVIPSGTRAVLDCRLLPGTSPEAMQAELEALIKDVPGVTLKVLQAFPAGVSEEDDALFDALARHAVEGRDDAVAGPVISPGYTDSILARAKGARAYGFTPFELTQEELATIHGRDERVSVKNVHRGLEVLLRSVVDVVAAP